MSRFDCGFVALLATAAIVSLAIANPIGAQEKGKPGSDTPATDEKPVNLTPEQILKNPAAAKGKKVEWQVTIVDVRTIQYMPPEFLLGMTDKDNKLIPKGTIFVNAKNLTMQKEAVEVFEGGKEKGKNARFKLTGEVVGVKKTKVGNKDQEVPELSKATMSLISK